MRLKPLSDRVLVKRVESETKTAGGIIIPDAAKEKPVEGIVVAVGPGKLSPEGAYIDVEVDEGDKVLFGQYSGIEVKVDGGEHLILREDEILAVVEEEKEVEPSGPGQTFPGEESYLSGGQCEVPVPESPVEEEGDKEV